jgi:hypothetical protein
MALSDKLQDHTVRANVVADFTQLIEAQVSAKNGLSGLALKAAYSALKGIGPGYISGAIGRILPDAFAALDPMWHEGMQIGDPVEHLIQNRSRTADTLLSVTDAKVEKSRNGIVRGSYNKLRKSVKGDVEEAVPDLAKIIGNHLHN